MADGNVEGAAAGQGGLQGGQEGGARARPSRIARAGLRPGWVGAGSRSVAAERRLRAAPAAGQGHAAGGGR